MHILLILRKHLTFLAPFLSPGLSVFWQSDTREDVVCTIQHTILYWPVSVFSIDFNYRFITSCTNDFIQEWYIIKSHTLYHFLYVSSVLYPKPVEIFPDHCRPHTQYLIRCRSFPTTVMFVIWLRGLSVLYQFLQSWISSYRFLLYVLIIYLVRLLTIICIFGPTYTVSVFLYSMSWAECVQWME